MRRGAGLAPSRQLRSENPPEDTGRRSIASRSRWGTGESYGEEIGEMRLQTGIETAVEVGSDHVRSAAVAVVVEALE